MKTFLTLAAFGAAAAGAHAEIVTKILSYDSGGTTFRSYLAYDDARTGGGKAPGVLVFPEWWGLNEFAKGKAEQLAKLGYVALAVDLYGEGRATTDPKEAKALSGQLYGKPLMAERARLGLDQLTSTGLADPGRLAAIGFCFGGAVSQVLAYSGAPVRGVVSFHGALVPPPEDAKAKTQAKFLVLHGALDPLVNKAAVDEFLSGMNARGLDYQFVAYSGAVHAFMNPDADKAKANGLDGVGYNAEAAGKAWSEMQTFLQGLFGAS